MKKTTMNHSKKILAIVLALMMVVSSFAGMTITANAAQKAINSGEVFCAGDTVLAPAGTYFKPDPYGSVMEITDNFTVDSIAYTYGENYRIDLSIFTGISMNTMDYPEAEEKDLVVVGIKFTGTGTESDPYMPTLALGDKEAVWDGEGKGTEASPYLIKTADDLRALSNNMKNDILYNGKFFKVTADINCGDSWEPIGAGKKFKGTFDGNGKTITYNISTDEMSAKYLGLFSRISYAGTVKHLNLAGSITATSTYAKMMGGVAGFNFGTVTDCASSVTITTPGDYIGGIVGINAGTVSNCAASGDLTWTQEDSRMAADLGGVAGTNRDGAVIKDCTALGNISAAVAGEYAGVGRVMARYYGTEENNYYLATATAVGNYITTGDATAKTAEELVEVGKTAYEAGNPVYAKALGYIPPPDTTPTPTPTPTPAPAPSSAPAKSGNINSAIKATVNKDGSITVKWGKMSQAAKYEVYAAYCEKDSKYKKIKTVNGSTTSYKISKLGGKKLNQKKSVKAYIVAYSKENGKYKKIGNSLTLHIVGKKNSKYSNAKAIKVKKDTYTLKVKKTATIKPTLVLENSKKKAITHVAKFRYKSSNTKVATVDKNGKITAKKKGTCIIYIYANNGMLKSVKVTVK